MAQCLLLNATVSQPSPKISTTSGAAARGRGLLVATAPLVLAAIVIGAPSPAAAVPAFARKYQTSCNTCHTVFPRLTAFGQVFRMAGYQFPGGQDEEMVEEEPVALGSDVYKKVFPDAVWPTTISHLAPLSVVVKSRVTAWEKDAAASPDFTTLEPTFDLYFTNSIGESISVFGKAQLNGPDCTNCHDYLAVVVNDLVPHSTVKVGKFQPEYFSFHQQPFVEFHDVLGPNRTVGSNAWNLGKDYGVELSGNVFGKGRYVVGVVEGAGNLPTSAKDLYARVAWKFGGARLDGKEDPSYETPSKNWRERSVMVGALFYKGWAKLASNDDVGAPLTVDDDFLVGAVDANLMFDSLNLFGGGVFQRHSAPTGTATDVLVERYFAGARYTHWPWLVPEVLFDYYNSELLGDYTFQLRGRVEVLARANVKVRFDVSALRPVGEAFSFRSGALLFDAAF